MHKLLSISLHDVRVSEERESIEKIESVMNMFNVPVTVLLICDEEIKPESKLFKFISRHIKKGNLEVVFHGITHKCLRKAGRYYAFYHKYEAEYIVDDDSIIENSTREYNNLKNVLNENIGICPPCWLSTKRNKFFFKSLSPLFIESLFHLRFPKNRVFSPVISIGSPKVSDIILLKNFVWLMYFIAVILTNSRVRLVVHPCDLLIDDSMNFFLKIFNKLKNCGFKCTLQKNMTIDYENKPLK